MSLVDELLKGKSDESEEIKKVIVPEEGVEFAPEAAPQVEEGMTHWCRYKQLILSDGSKVQASPLGGYSAEPESELEAMLSTLVERGEAFVVNKPE